LPNGLRLFRARLGLQMPDRHGVLHRKPDRPPQATRPVLHEQRHDHRRVQLLCRGDRERVLHLGVRLRRRALPERLDLRHASVGQGYHRRQRRGRPGRERRNVGPVRRSVHGAGRGPHAVSSVFDLQDGDSPRAKLSALSSRGTDQRLHHASSSACTRRPAATGRSSSTCRSQIGRRFVQGSVGGVLRFGRKQPVLNGDDSSPAASASGVYVSYAGNQVYDFSPTIWFSFTV
jgi:hypothetical protein